MPKVVYCWPTLMKSCILGQQGKIMKFKHLCSQGRDAATNTADAQTNQPQTNRPQTNQPQIN